MSLKLGTQDISGISQNTKYNAHHLLDFKWTDCIMNDVSWLRADTFSWQSGDVYTSVYNHLVQDLQGTTAETETIGSYTVTFYRATDKHKIVLADQEATVLNIYNETGIAWYYVLDTTNTQFKLPRTKFGFEGLRTNVGDNIEAGLPAMTTGTAGGHNHSYTRYANLNGAYTAMYNSGCLGGAGDSTSWNGDHTHTINTGVRTTDTVQPPATQMYLYFYVGDYSQTAIEQTAGLNSELFNGKADINLTNVTNKLSDNFLEKLTPDWDNRISMGLPQYPISTTANTFTCPSIGYISVHGDRSTAGYTLSVMINSIAYGQAPAYSSLFYDGFFIVNKGDVIKFITDSTSQTWSVPRQFFIPMKGAN